MKTVADTVDDNKPVNGLVSTKKNRGNVPKKIHKAEREKLKRDNLNEIFFELGHALDPARQNNGKATILCDTTRLLRDLIALIGSLKKENAALLNEFHYVTLEKDELRDDNAAIQAEIFRLQKELRERMQVPFLPFSDPAVSVRPPSPPKPSSRGVSRPHPRYPTPESWPLEFLHRNLKAAGCASNTLHKEPEKA
ncbi:Transcription factor bHLH47 [Platanthera guangdongensis]|uniref:Transcription factor bHLH47 n=1 Tax=Platanthera guangdongensis TaxID=2320717 RepID=A0ABR2LYY2_9ASPA